MSDIVEKLRASWEWPNADTRQEAAAEIVHLREDVVRLRRAGVALYMAGRWSCDQPVDEVALWTALRDAIGLPIGTEAARAEAAKNNSAAGVQLSESDVVK